MALKQQPMNAGLPRRAPTPYDNRNSSSGWQRFYVVVITVSASALLATLITFGVLNFLLSDVQLPNQRAVRDLNNAATLQQQQQLLQQQLGSKGAALGNGTAPAAVTAPPMTNSPAAAPLVRPPPPAKWSHPLKYLKGYYSIPPKDSSPRCMQSKICDGDHSCSPDGLGCVTSAKERQDRVRKAIAWAWEGYRQHAWGHDEVNGLSKTPRGWFNMGLTIVDSLDTLMIAGLHEEYQQARHWVANHLQFKDGSSVQFFEVNIRILGGLLSAYYLSDGDDMYLHKAQMLADRLMVAFNTSSGIPVTYVQFQDAEGRAHSGSSDGGTNQAEAGTISMEFTTIGRLLGRDDMFDAGNQFWYVLMSSRNFSGLYCMGIHTSNGGCTDPKMSIGSAADSMYEYMLKQWVLSGKTQEVPLQLYKEAMVGVRKYLLRHVYDGEAHVSFVSEATANQQTGEVSATNDRFEHLTCFAGGMFVLGRMNNISTKLSEEDFDDGEVGARIGRTCYEMYHQVVSGVAPDSIAFLSADGSNLPPNDPSTHSRMAPPRIKAPHTKHKKQAAGKPAAMAAGVGGAAGAPGGGQQHAPDDVHHAPRPTDAGSEAEKPGQAKQAPKPEDVQEVQPGVVAHAPKPQDTAQAKQQQPQQQPGSEGGQAPATRRLMSKEDLLQLQQQQLQQHVQQAIQQPAGAEMLDEQLQAAVQQQLAEMTHQQVHLQLHDEAQESQQQQVEEEAEVVASAAAAEEAGLQGSFRRLLADSDAVAADAGEADADSTDANKADRGTTDGNAAPDADDNGDKQLAGDPTGAVGDAALVIAPSPPPPSPPPPSPPPPPSSPPPPSPPPPPPPGPVIARWSQLSSSDFLRPEAIETLFYLWRATGDDMYREWGWNMFRGFERWCRLPSGGYVTLSNVNMVPPQLSDKMESFFLAETLKYFYMLFEEDPTVLPLDQWVFNTEAHPLPIWGTPADKRAQERLKQRRLAQLKEQKRRQAEEEAVRAQEELKRLTEQVAGGKGKPQDRDGYGLAGLI